MTGADFRIQEIINPLLDPAVRKSRTDLHTTSELSLDNRPISFLEKNAHFSIQVRYKASNTEKKVPERFYFPHIPTHGFHHSPLSKINAFSLVSLS